MPLRRELPNADNRRVLTPGETMRVRRQRLKWTITTAAEKAGINRETVVNIEKDRGVTTRRLEAYKAALDEAEKENALTGSVIAPSTTDTDVVRKLTAARAADRRRLQRLETFVSEVLNEIRRGLAEDADDAATTQRKSG